MEQVMTTKERQEFYQSRDKTVLVDFDGTLTQWAYPEMGDPEPGARSALKYLQEQGCEIIIWTCRLSPEFNTTEERIETFGKIIEWLLRHDIPYDRIDTGASGKLLGAVWVDDQAVGYRGNWDAAVRDIEGRLALREARNAKNAAD